jgi:hypothetical protein
MLHVMTLRFQPGLSADQRNGALARRAKWTYPSGTTPVAEFWPASDDLAVVSAFEADSYGPIMEIVLAWGDVFQIQCYPAVTAEEGLRIGPEALRRAMAPA